MIEYWCSGTVTGQCGVAKEYLFVSLFRIIYLDVSDESAKAHPAVMVVENRDVTSSD